MWIPLDKYVRENFESVSAFMEAYGLGFQSRYYQIIDKPTYINIKSGKIFRTRKRAKSDLFSDIRYAESMNSCYISFPEFFSKSKMSIDEFVDYFGINSRSRFYHLKNLGCEINEMERAIYLPPKELKPRVPQKRRKNKRYDYGKEKTKSND
ncbi:hypothetical protein NB600_00020 [Vibrio antiquarius]|uniref:hypothetical protein n=1 Tax=Vibrio antiquarius (strain Ex25) TaxID=150340 RepID=UPI00265D4074|nr:hypothetical protein [Vibrio antiquarius]MCR9684213.1 hypothetical protein [Vibrio antiquarius]